MVNTAIVGCNGKMGCFVAQAVQSREDCNVLFGVDAFGESNYDLMFSRLLTRQPKHLM